MRQPIHIRNRYIFLLDIIFIALVTVLSYLLRLEAVAVYLDYLPTIGVMLVIAYLVKPLVYRKFGLYQRFWVYASAGDALTITLAVTVAWLITGIAMFSLHGLHLFKFFSRSVIFIDWPLSLLAVGGVRFLPRLITEALLNNKNGSGIRQALIVGAGDAGALVVREMQKNNQLKTNPLGFLDDDLDKQANQIYGVPVIGRLTDLEQQLDIQPVDEVIIAIPSAPGSVVRQVADVCRRKGVPFRTMPGIYELLGGKVSVNRLREVDITDLLRREHTPIDDRRVGRILSGKRVLITGAGGSIASELCRQIARWGPDELVILGHGENSIFSIVLELEELYPSLPLQPVIADVRHIDRLQHIFNNYKPQVVFHAAAHKHVPLMEKNISEAVTNNVLGTRNVVQVASQNGVERLVMISTDKAVRPSSIMGATKRLAEMLVLDAAESQSLAYSVVRFGNVLGSRGSVIPLFKRQIARGGPVTVTHPDVERYFMTIPEAVHLVLQAFAMERGGEVFVLDMGEPVRIMALAEDLIRLSGLEPGRDIEIAVTGLRPGEKLSEELWDENASYHPTDHPEITRLTGEEVLSGEALQHTVDQLVALANKGKEDEMVQLLDESISGARIRSTPPPELTSLV